MKNFFFVLLAGLSLALFSCQKDSLAVVNDAPQGFYDSVQDRGGHHPHDSTYVGDSTHQHHPHDSTHVPHDTLHVHDTLHMHHFPFDSMHIHHPFDSTHVDTTGHGGGHHGHHGHHGG